jgi:hypothetical protein
MGEWRYRSTHSQPELYMKVSDQLYAKAALPQVKEPPVSIEKEAG